MTTTTTNSSVCNRFSQLDALRTEAIIDGRRFGDRDALALVLCEDLTEADALFPTCEVLGLQGFDVQMMAQALECGAIDEEQLGAIVDRLAPNDANTAVGAMLQRHLDNEPDYQALEAAGYDVEAIQEALELRLLTKRQLRSLIDNQTREDVDTAISALLDRAELHRWN